MSNMMKKYGGLILFYGIILVSVILLNERFRYLKQLQERGLSTETTIAIQSEKEDEKNV